MSANSKNLAYAVQALLGASLAAADIAATTWVGGTAIDLQSSTVATGEEAAFLAIANTALTYKLQTSSDNSTWTDVSGAASSSALAANAPFLVSVGRARLYRYVRVAWYSASAVTGKIVAAAYLGHSLKKQPHGLSDGSTYINLGN